MDQVEAAWARLERAAEAAAERADRRPVRGRARPAGAADAGRGGPAPRPVQAGLGRRGARRRARRWPGRPTSRAARRACSPASAINASEGRAVLHTALRAPDGADVRARGRAGLRRGRGRPRGDARLRRSGALGRRSPARPASRSGAVLHIGIGGSDLGPRLVWEALRPLDAADRAALRRQCRRRRDRRGAGRPGSGARPWWWSSPRPSPPRRPWPTPRPRAPGCAARWARPATAIWSPSPPRREAAAAFGVPARPGVRLLRLGRRAVTRSGRRWGCPAPSAWAGRRSSGFWPAPRPWTTTSPTRPAGAQRAGAAGARPRVQPQRPGPRRARGRPLRPAPAPAAGLPAAAGDGVQRQAGRRRTAGRCRAPPPRWCSATPAPTPSTPSSSCCTRGPTSIPVDFIAVARSRRGPGRRARQAAGQLPGPGRGPDGRPRRGRGPRRARGQGAGAGRIDELAPQRAFPGNRPSSLILLDAADARGAGRADRPLRAQDLRRGRALGDQQLRPVGRRARQGDGRPHPARAGGRPARARTTRRRRR